MARRIIFPEAVLNLRTGERPLKPPSVVDATKLRVDHLTLENANLRAAILQARQETKKAEEALRQERVDHALTRHKLRDLRDSIRKKAALEMAGQQPSPPRRGIDRIRA
jgi:hypothetical protein